VRRLEREVEEARSATVEGSTKQERATAIAANLTELAIVKEQSVFEADDLTERVKIAEGEVERLNDEVSSLHAVLISRE